MCLTTCRGSVGPSRHTWQKFVRRSRDLYGNIDFVSPTSGCPGKRTVWPMQQDEWHWTPNVTWTCRSRLTERCTWSPPQKRPSAPTMQGMKTYVMRQYSGRSASGVGPPWQSHKMLVGSQRGRLCQRTSTAFVVGVVRLLLGNCHCTVARFWEAVD